MCALIFLVSHYNNEADDEGDEDDESGGDGVSLYNKLLMPEVVISLDAGDEFLKDRVMNLPQAEVEGTHNTEEGTYYSIFFVIQSLNKLVQPTKHILCCYW